MVLKRKGKALVYSIVSAVLGLLSFLGFAAKWIMVMNINGTSVSQTNYGYKTFFDLFIKGQKTAYLNPALLKVSFAVMIVLLICVTVLAVAMIVQLFVEHKALAKVAKISRLLTFLLAIVFVGLFVAGGMTCFKTSGMQKIMVIPYIGVYWMVMASVASAWFAKRALKQKKADKNQTTEAQ